jgi:endonuclease YncB( thermonuclease family)
MELVSLMQKTVYEYAGTIRRVIDGDTVEVAISLGFFTYRVENVRLFGINAPEIHSADEIERGWAAKSRDALAAILPVGANVVLRTHKDKEKYGRFLAEIFTADNRNVSAAMLATGLAVAYNGAAKRPFKEAFAHLLK